MSGSRSPLLPSAHYTIAEDSDSLEYVLRKSTISYPLTFGYSLLCAHFNVIKATLQPASQIPTSIDMRVRRDAHMPSHVLAVYDIPESEWGPAYQPLLVPIRVDIFTRDFRSNIIPPSPPGSTFPVPHCVQHTVGQVVTLPVIPLLVPHAPSIPLLLLFGLGLDTRSHLLCCHLLPPEVIGEFPAHTTMANLMATLCSDDQLRQHYKFNRGLWKNILALGPQDSKFIGLVQTALNVTVEARRIRKCSQACTIPPLPK